MGYTVEMQIWKWDSPQIDSSVSLDHSYLSWLFQKTLRVSFSVDILSVFGAFHPYIAYTRCEFTKNRTVYFH